MSRDKIIFIWCWSSWYKKPRQGGFGKVMMTLFN